MKEHLFSPAVLWLTLVYSIPVGLEFKCDALKTRWKVYSYANYFRRLCSGTVVLCETVHKHCQSDNFNMPISWKSPAKRHFFSALKLNIQEYSTNFFFFIFVAVFCTDLHVTATEARKGHGREKKWRWTSLTRDLAKVNHYFFSSHVPCGLCKQPSVLLRFG